MATTTFTDRTIRDAPYRIEYDPRTPDAASTAIVEAVAAIDDTPARDLEPLYETVDPDALERFVATADGGVVEFDYHGYGVVVRSDEDAVVVTD